MPVVTGFAHDVFVSYAHDDNLAFRDFQWVDHFVNDLQARLSSLIGNTADVWRDPRLGGNSALEPELTNRLKKSAALLVIVSPAYQRSLWCRWELEKFLQLHDPNRISGRCCSRVVRVDKLPVDSRNLPEGLATAQAFCFYRMDPHSRYPQEFIPSEAAYGTRVDESSAHIASVLAILNERIGGDPGNGR